MSQPLSSLYQSNKGTEIGNATTNDSNTIVNNSNEKINDNQAPHGDIQAAVPVVHEAPDYCDDGIRIRTSDFVQRLTARNKLLTVDSSEFTNLSLSYITFIYRTLFKSAFNRYFQLRNSSNTESLPCSLSYAYFTPPWFPE